MSQPPDAAMIRSGRGISSVTATNSVPATRMSTRPSRVTASPGATGRAAPPNGTSAEPGEARRRVERDLHDGAQQRLVALDLDLQRARRVVRLVERPRRSGPMDRLTERDREVLALMAEGHSNRSIAETLVVNQRTAETHVSNILTKLDLPRTLQWTGGPTLC